MPDHTGTEDGQLQLGTGNDLKLYHDGSNSFIQDVGTGNLYIQSTSAGVYIQKVGGEDMGKFLADGAVELYHDNSKKFETYSNGCTVTGNLNAGNVDLADDAKARFGASNDLQIFPDGNDSVIKDAGTGRLSIQTSHLQVANAANSETILNAFENGAVELYHDNSKKFNTRAAGIDITGDLRFDTSVTGGIVRLADNQKVFCGSGDDLQIFHDGTDNIINSVNGNLIFKHSNNIKCLVTGGDFRPSTGNNIDLGVSSAKWQNVHAIRYYGDGSNLTGISGGKILQVVSNVYKTDQTFSTQGSFFDTGLTATITPTSSSSHILVSAQLTFQPHGATTLEFRVLRGSTVLDVGVSGGGSQALVAGSQDGSRGSYPSMQIFDEGLSKSSSTTYKVQARVHNANSRINGRDTDYRACSVMTLMEVSA